RRVVEHAVEAARRGVAEVPPAALLPQGDVVRGAVDEQPVEARRPIGRAPADHQRQRPALPPTRGGDLRVGEEALLADAQRPVAVALGRAEGDERGNRLLDPGLSEESDLASRRLLAIPLKFSSTRA